MDDRLKDRVAIVTGAASGIGEGIARMFRKEGAMVIGIDRDGAVIACDRTDEISTGVLFAQIDERHGRIDLLVNAAAFAVFAWIEKMSHADWKHALTGELDIVFLPTRAAWPLLNASGSASVINFRLGQYPPCSRRLSGAGALRRPGGVQAMTRRLAMEGGPHNTCANTNAPGLIRTAATARHLAADTAFEQQMLVKNMLKRLGQPEDIA